MIFSGAYETPRIGNVPGLLLLCKVVGERQVGMNASAGRTNERVLL